MAVSNAADTERSAELQMVADGWARLGIFIQPLSTRLSTRCLMISGKYFMRAFNRRADDAMPELTTVASLAALASTIDTLVNGDAP